MRPDNCRPDNPTRCRAAASGDSLKVSQATRQTLFPYRSVGCRVASRDHGQNQRGAHEQGPVGHLSPLPDFRGPLAGEVA
jgi:hypothetical protein